MRLSGVRLEAASLRGVGFALALLYSGAAHAAVDFVAHFSFRFEFALTPPLEVNAVGVAPLDATGGLQSVGIPAFGGTDSSPLPASYFYDEIELQGNVAAGTLNAAGGPGNTLPITGLLRFIRIGPPPPFNASNWPLQGAGGAGLGVGGSWKYVPPGRTAGSPVFAAAHWRLGTAMAQSGRNASLTSVTRSGFVHGPLSNTSTIAQPDGVIQFVTPLQVTQQWGSTVDKFAAFGTLKIRLIPEPNLVLLLVPGALVLVALGRDRARRGPPGAVSRRGLSATRRRAVDAGMRHPPIRS
jgi:hypothetical protein